MVVSPRRERPCLSVFLMNVTSVEEARALLTTLPLDEEKLIEYDLIELGPLRPLYLLLGEGLVKFGH
jgi:hypothetical protein